MYNCNAYDIFVVGHLVELSQPEAYDEKYNKWAYADLPIFPDQWKYPMQIWVDAEDSLELW